MRKLKTFKVKSEKMTFVVTVEKMKTYKTRKEKTFIMKSENLKNEIHVSCLTIKFSPF